MIAKLLHKITGLTRPRWVNNVGKTHHREDNNYLVFTVDGQECKITIEAYREGVDRSERHANRDYNTTTGSRF